MQIGKIELVRLRTKFRQEFHHAASSRAMGDAIIICITDDLGRYGFGEVQARPYVTGESNDAIWEKIAIEFGSSLLGRTIAGTADIYDSLGGDGIYQSQPAMVGGFDLALHDLFDVQNNANWTRIIGPRRATKTARCLTIGSDYSGTSLKKQAMISRVGKYAVVKLKIAGEGDVSRIQDLRKSLGSNIRIRLDANSALQLEEAIEILTKCRECQIESIEEPFDKSSPGLVDKLKELRRVTGAHIVADESVCTTADLKKFDGASAYQSINVRVGKCGGISGTVKTIRDAQRANLGVLAGTMVGETKVLLHFSDILLRHCDAISYVEGIDQSERLLQSEAIVPDDSLHDRHFRWTPNIDSEIQIERKSVE